MCGIAGYLTVDAERVPSSVLARMTDQIEHRGPDGNGYYRDAFANLGHRRLSIIDLAGGSQPMYNEDRTLVIVYNGEVFNHAAVREPLEQAGHRYGSRCDTETLLHAYEQWGVDSLSHYRGMFSFAIWDTEKRELFCARDRLGIKPFYYYFNGRDFVFGSEIKAILKHPAVTAKVDAEGLPEYLTFGYRGASETLFEGIKQLSPGYWLKARLVGSRWDVEIQAYWDAPIVNDPGAREDVDWVGECRRRLEETVQMRLMSDVPLGVFLSGGVDSSSIAALMKKFTNEAINTFSVGYEDARYSELSYASEVARYLGTRHHEVILSKEAFFNYLPRVTWHEDEPVTWPSSVSLYCVSQLAAKHVKVVLTGEGSDELFAGYARYRHLLRGMGGASLVRNMPTFVRTGVRNIIEESSLLNADLRRKLQHTVLGREDTFNSLYLDNYYAAFSEAETRRLVKGSSSDPYKGFAEVMSRAQNANMLRRLLYADQKTYLSELLRKQDRMSMACSIESRVPLLDHRLTEFSAGIPNDWKIRGKEGKFIVKKAVEGLLPDSIIWRTKMGFPTPIKNWLQGETLTDIRQFVLSEDGLAHQYLDRDAIRKLFEQYESGKSDCTDRIWRLLTMQMWHAIFIEGKQYQTLTLSENLHRS